MIARLPTTPRGRLLLGAIVLLAALGLAWVGRAVLAQDDRAWTRIQSERVLRVATDASYPPFSAVGPDGALYGLDVDLARALGERLGVAVRIENITYDALLQAVASERVDLVISAFVADNNQLDDAAYSDSYFVAGLRAVVPATDTVTLDSLAPWTWATGRLVGAEYGSMADVLTRQWSRRAAGVRTQLYPTAAEALAGLESRDVQAALVDAVTAYEFVSGNAGYHIEGPVLEPEPYVIATGARSPRLLSEINRLLREIEEDGTLPTLRERYLGSAAR